MKLMVISNPASFNGEAKLINQLFDHGLEIFHLRKPEIDKVGYKLLLTEIALQYHDRIALHGHHHLAEEFGIKRLHYTENSRKKLPEGWLKNKNPDQIMSTSIHIPAELNSVQEFDYVLLGPVFDSFSKVGYKAIAAEDLDLRSWRLSPHLQTNLKIIALGGIGINTIERVKPIGFDGAAMLGWIWNDPSMALANLKQIRCWIKENT